MMTEAYEIKVLNLYDKLHDYHLKWETVILRAHEPGTGEEIMMLRDAALVVWREVCRITGGEMPRAIFDSDDLSVEECRRQINKGKERLNL